MIQNLPWVLKIFIGLIFTSPLMFGGFTFYDEFFLIFFLVYFFFTEKNFKIKNYFFLKNRLNIFFFLTILYFIVQSLRGFIFFFNFDEIIEIKKLRWLIFFLIIICIFLIFNFKKKIIINFKSCHNIISHTSFIFITLYLSLIVLFSYFTGNKYGLEYANFPDFGILATSAYLSPLLCLMIPSTFICISNHNIKLDEFLKYCFFLSLIFSTLFFLSSRFSLAFLLIYFFLFLFTKIKILKKIQVIILFVVFSVIILLLLDFANYFLDKPNQYYFFDILKSLSPVIENGSYEHGNYGGKFRDIDRILMNYIAILHMFNDFNLYNILFGTGLRTVSLIIYETQFEILNFYGITSSLSTNVGTTGFATILIETGITGYLLILILSIVNTINLYKKKFPIMVCVIPSIFVLNLFIINSFDLILFYVLLIPGMIEEIYKIN